MIFLEHVFYTTLADVVRLSAGFRTRNATVASPVPEVESNVIETTLASSSFAIV